AHGVAPLPLLYRSRYRCRGRLSALRPLRPRQHRRQCAPHPLRVGRHARDTPRLAGRTAPAHQPPCQCPYTEPFHRVPPGFAAGSRLAEGYARRQRHRRRRRPSGRLRGALARRERASPRPYSPRFALRLRHPLTSLWLKKKRGHLFPVEMAPLWLHRFGPEESAYLLNRRAGRWAENGLAALIVGPRPPQEMAAVERGLDSIVLRVAVGKREVVAARVPPGVDIDQVRIAASPERRGRLCFKNPLSRISAQRIDGRVVRVAGIVGNCALRVKRPGIR